MKRVPVLFCDIDGTIRKGPRELGHHINCIEDVQVYPEIPAILKQYKDASWRIAGVSNQERIGMGKDIWLLVMQWFHETDHQCGNVFNSFQLCPHYSLDDKPICFCHKPAIGLLVKALEDCMWCNNTSEQEVFPLNLMLMVGNSHQDEQCAVNAGIRFMRAEQWRRIPAERHPV